MSGGYFNYQQYHIVDIAGSIDDYIYGHQFDDDIIDKLKSLRTCGHELTSEDEYIIEHGRSMPNPDGYTPETLEELKRGLAVMRMAYVYAQQIDWLLSADYDEETFHMMLEKELDGLNLLHAKQSLKTNNI